MKNTKIKFSKGVSLIELIIYISIVAIILVAVTDLSTRMVFGQLKTAKISEVTENVNFVTEILTGDIEDATSVAGSYPSDTLTIVTGGQTRVFTLTSGTLTVSTNASLAVPITTSSVSVAALPASSIFTKITNGADNSIQVKFKVSSVADPNNNYTAETTILARSK